MLAGRLARDPGVRPSHRPDPHVNDPTAPGPVRRPLKLGLAVVAISLATGVLSLLACRASPPELVDGPALSTFAPGARFWRQTCELELGAEAAELALIGGWSDPEPDGAWRWSTAQRSALWIEALGGEPHQLGFEAFAYHGAADPRPQSVAVAVAGRRLAELELGLEPAEHVVEVPAGLLVPGRNRVELTHARSAPAPGGDPRLLAAGWRRLWLRPRTADAGERACEQTAWREGRFDGEALHLPWDSGVELFVASSEAGWLVVDSVRVVDVAGDAAANGSPRAGGRGGDPADAESAETAGAGASGHPQAGTPGAGTGRLEVTVERAPASEGEVLRTTAEIAAGGDRPLRVSLPAGDGPLRVAFVARRSSERSTASREGAARTELVVEGARLAGPAARRGSLPQRDPDPDKPPGALAAEWQERPNVLIYLVDTLRADHLGCYGYPLPTSPRLDRLAEQGVLFERAVAQSSWTRPTVATVLTGLDPRVHGVHGRDDRLPAAVVTLPERLQELGYDTLAVVTNGNVAPAFGFDQGFDRFTYLPERPRRGRHRRSNRVTELAGAWLEERVAGSTMSPSQMSPSQMSPSQLSPGRLPRGETSGGERRPFFMYLHTTDPHAPYTPAPRYRERFLGGASPPAAFGSLPHLRELAEDHAALSSAAVADLVALYDAEIAFNDHSFGALLDRLESLGLARDTLVVFLADHGEEFGEHGGWQHGRTLYQDQLHVPLVLRLPGGVLAGTRRTELVQQTDIVPTVLEVVGAPLPEGLQGRSLVRRIPGGPDLEVTDELRPAFAVLDLDGNQVEAALDRDRKLVRRHRTARPWPRRIELFELAADPQERLDRSATRPVWLGYLDALLRSRHVLWPAAAPAEQAVIDAELADELRALGYVQ